MCPGRAMFSLSPMVPHVSMWNSSYKLRPADSAVRVQSDKILPMGYANGGMVDESHVNIPDGVLPKNDPDRVFARLMPGELVIPKKHVPYVAKMLKKKGIKLNGM